MPQIMNQTLSLEKSKEILKVRKLGSAGPRFNTKKGRDDIMTKPSEYTFEEYYEFDQYSRSPES